jgi:hypothetical protein
MQSFILNSQRTAQSFSCSSAKSKFVLVEVIVHQQSLDSRELRKFLSGFYLEIEEVCDVGNNRIRTRSRPFELSKEIDSSNNSVQFNKIISNEHFDADGSEAFYNKLNVKLISRYGSSHDLVVEIVYDGPHCGRN